jgi:hypothetical protein
LGKISLKKEKKKKKKKQASLLKEGGKSKQASPGEPRKPVLIF